MPLLAVFRDADGIAGLIGSVYLGLRLPRGSRIPRPRREPIILDVRLPAHSNGPTWHFRPDLSPQHREEMISQFEGAVKKELGWGLAAVVYRMVTDEAAPLVTRPGALVRDSPGSSSMPISWSGVDGWLATLSKNRRKTLRRQMRWVEEAADLAVVTGRGRTDLDPAELAAMNSLHTARLASALDPRADLPPAYFERLLGREDVIFISYHDTTSSRLLAYTVIFDHPDTPISATWAALRPEEGGRQDLYFDCHTRIVRTVTGNGAKTLLGGRGRLDIKRSLGFDMVPMKVVAVPRWKLR
ncbi:GNAT family N-acetyltransferase [Nonomuraea sp. NBC_01738]|uniref:GNAT family N-acetyltransferase n=1 Tax=Nonomuraea sp. NBC_01738 TaxID=2976003 RepID=UPI002E0F9F57|nr:GNAT family N-acetyltransferase [Nonomuraea sp. NBC_01738]